MKQPPPHPAGAGDLDFWLENKETNSEGDANRRLAGGVAQEVQAFPRQPCTPARGKSNTEFICAARSPVGIARGVCCVGRPSLWISHDSCYATVS